MAQIKVDYIDHMGTDLSVVNAARVSFNKDSDWEYACVADCAEHGFRPGS
jgi:thymidylate synthase (FAD)